MKKYLKPIILIIVSFVLIILSGCSITSTPTDTHSDGYVSPDEFIEMNIQASEDGFTFPFTMDDVKTMQSYICSMLRTDVEPREFEIKMFIYTSPEFPELTANQLGQFAAYVANYACLSDALALKAQVSS